MAKKGYNYNLQSYQYGQDQIIPLDSSGINNYQFRNELAAIKLTERWPGLPKDPANPVFQEPVSHEYDPFPLVEPVPVVNRRKRGGGYANLSNYNTIP